MMKGKKQATWFVAICAVLVLGIVVSGAAAGRPGGDTCSNSNIGTGTYNGMTVIGTCTIDDGATVTINGNVNVTNGAILNDHAASTATVNITGNVIVGKGAVLGLGFGPEEVTEATVGGTILAYQPQTLYLGNVTVRGGVVSIGGGDPGRNFAIKGNTIRGDLIVDGWHGLWMGLLRNTVGRNVIVSRNVAANTSQVPGSDSTEVVQNTISGSLICLFNTPDAQIGDSQGAINTVGGHKIGECAGL